MPQSPYEYYMSNSLATPYGDQTGEFYTDMLRRSVLESAFSENDCDVDAGEELHAIYFNWKNYEAAERIAAALFDKTNDKVWLVKQLRCLVLDGDYDRAEELYEEHQAQYRKPVLSGWDTIQFMRDTIFSDDFLDMDVQDYEKLFYLKPLMRKLGPHLRFLSYSLMDRFFIDLLILAKDYVERSGATFYYMSSTGLPSVQNKSECERMLMESVALATKEKRKLKWLQSNPPHMADVHRGLPQYNDDYIAQLNPGLRNIVQATRLMICDWDSEYFNIRDGKRVTVGQPKSYDHTVHCVGESETFGYGTEDAYTFSSFLQDKLNRKNNGKRYRVENHGFPGGALPFSVNNLLQINIFAGDIVVFFGFPELDTEVANQLSVQASHVSFSRPHDYGEVFVDDNHFGWSGHKVIADALYDRLFQTDRIVSSQKPTPETLDAAQCCIKFVKYLLFRRTYLAVEESSMKKYLNYLDEARVTLTGQIGSVAVNCDPMTNGHLHLIEHAARSCDFLYVFVIEEDGAYFKFKERFEIVKQGLSHLDNIKVLKGGRYICTDVTLPEYSTKGANKNASIDLSMEAWSFGEFIAKRLNITRIFLGREPICQVTRQYNEQMEKILPRFGIEVEIIERIEYDGAVISASSVRRFLSEKRLDLIRNIVPKSTYDYLVRYHT